MSMGNSEIVAVKLSLKDRSQFSADADRARRDVKDIGDEAERSGRKARSAGGGFMMLSQSLGGGLRAGVGIGVTALGVAGAAVGALAVKTVGLAMDAAETGAAFGTVFKGIESSVTPVIEQLNADFGIPTAELQQAATSFGVFGKAAGVAQSDLGGFTTDLTTAGLDLASFYNADPSEVFLALRSGLAGEAEPLRKFGIFLSDATMKAKALEMGIGGASGELSESEKVMVRQAVIMESLGDAEGDMARTSEGLANQWRGLKGRGIEMATAIGTALLPAATNLANTLNTHLQPAVAWMQNNGVPMIQGFINTLGGEFTQAWNVLNAYGVWGWVQQLDDALGLDGGLMALFQDFVQAGRDIWTILSTAVVPAFMDLSEIIPDILQPTRGLNDVLGFLADHADVLRPIIVGLTAAYLANAAASRLLNIQSKIAVGLQKIQAAGGLLQFLKTIPIITAATKAWSIAQAALNFVMSMNPIMLVVLAIAALVAGVIWAYNNVEWFRDGVDAAFSWIQNVIGSVISWVSDNWPLLLAIITGPIGLAVLFITRHWDTIKGGVADVVSWVVMKFHEWLDFVTGLPGRMAAMGRGIFDWIKDAFRGAINFVIDAWNGLEFKIPGFDPPGPGPKFDGFTLGVPDLERLHTGGVITSSGSAIIKPDEEVVVLPTAASVIPLNNQEDDIDLSRFTGGGGADGGWPSEIVLKVDGRELARITKKQAQTEMARR